MDSQLKKAISLASNNKIDEAINLLNIVKKDAAFIERASRLIIQIGFKFKLYKVAKAELELLVDLFPNNFEYCSTLVDLYLSEKN